MRAKDLVTDLRQSGRDVVLTGFAASPLVPRVLRWRLLRLLGMNIGKSAINPYVWFGTREISIGVGTFVNYFCKFDGPTALGENCNIGYDVMFCTNSHAIGSSSRRAGVSKTSPIRVGDGVWIGARAVILPGVDVGSGCVVAAGAIVTSDCAPNGLYRGAPARRVRELETTAVSSD
jgi:maltose O-acetyltransferase